jgi:hypothetical protein
MPLGVLRALGRAGKGAGLVKCWLGWHQWGWAVDRQVAGQRFPAQPCQRCPAVRWLGPRTPGGSADWLT